MAIKTAGTAATSKTTSGTSIVSGALTTTSVNCLLLAFVATSFTGNSGNVTSVTGGSLTWQQAVTTNGIPPTNGIAAIYRTFASSIVSGSTVTANFGTSSTSAIYVVAFSGVVQGGTSGSAAIGATGRGASSTGTPTASLTTTGQNSWVWGVAYDWTNSVTPTTPAGQTRQNLSLHATNGDSAWLQSQTNATSASGVSVTINNTTPTADNWGMVSVEILCAAGDTPLNPMHRSGIPESHRLANF